MLKILEMQCMNSANVGHIAGPKESQNHKILLVKTSVDKAANEPRGGSKTRPILKFTFGDAIGGDWTVHLTEPIFRNATAKFAKVNHWQNLPATAQTREAAERETKLKEAELKYSQVRSP